MTGLFRRKPADWQPRPVFLTPGQLLYVNIPGGALRIGVAPYGATCVTIDTDPGTGVAAACGGRTVNGVCDSVVIGTGFGES